MKNRREFVRGLTVSAAIAGSYTRAVAESPKVEQVRPSLDFGGRQDGRLGLIIDRAIEGASEFAVEANRLGASVRTFDHDPGCVWAHEIEPQWKRGPGMIAGFTARMPLHYLEILARDYGVGVLYHVEHSKVPSQGYRHILHSPPALQEWQGALESAGEDWFSVAAQLIIHSSTLIPGATATATAMDSSSSRHADTSLYSWLMIPSGRPGVSTSLRNVVA